MKELAWEQKLEAFSVAQKKVILEELQRIVQNGVYGSDYTIAPRDKNRELRKRYYITDEKIKEILLSLQVEHFMKVEDTNHPEHPGDIVCKFKRSYPLIPKWIEEADYEEVTLYIKMVKPDVDEVLFIISFHEDE